MAALLNNRPFAIVTGLALVAVLGFIDFTTGYDLNFFVFYFIPISLSAWRASRTWGVILSFISALAWGFADYLSGHHYSQPVYYFWNAVIRLASFIILAFTLDMIHSLLVRQRAINDELKHTLAEIKQLRGYLPICASCKKIRNDGGYWEQIEKYISEHSEAEFTHGLCPECAKRLYPDLLKEENKEPLKPEK